jgi:hypothetical protein
MRLARDPGPPFDVLVHHGGGRRGRFRAWGWTPALVCLVSVVLAAGCGDSRGPRMVSGSSVPGQGTLVLRASVAKLRGSCTGTMIRFNLGGMLVLTNPNTQFETRCPTVANGMPVEAQGLSGTNGVLAARIAEADAGAVSGPEFKVEGPISRLGPGFDCVTVAGRRVTVAGFAFQVGNAFTGFGDIPGGCQGMVAGLKIEAQGSLRNPPTPPAAPFRAREVALGE